MRSECESLSLDLTTGATVRRCRSVSVRALPGADRLPAQPARRGERSVRQGRPCARAGDEIAIIPPVAGG